MRRASERDLRAKQPGYQPVFGPPPTAKPRYVRGAAKRLGPWKAIGFTLNKSTLEAINELKRRYKEAHSGESWKDHVAEIVRDAVAGVLRKGGPVLTERERLCIREWRYTLRFPIAQY